MFANIVFGLALRYQLRYHGVKLTPEEAQVIENKQGHLQKLIDKFCQVLTGTCLLDMSTGTVVTVETKVQWSNVGSDEDGAAQMRQSKGIGLWDKDKDKAGVLTTATTGYL